MTPPKGKFTFPSPGASQASVLDGTPSPRADGAITASAARGHSHPIALADITPDPSNPRTAKGLAPITDRDVAVLAESIRVSGLIQPIVVRPAPADSAAAYVIVAGESRFHAARLAGLTKIDAIIRTDLTDVTARVVRWRENADRTDLSPLKVAIALDEMRTGSPEAVAAGRDLTWEELLHTPYGRSVPKMALQWVYPRLVALPAPTQQLIVDRPDLSWRRLYDEAFRNVRDVADVHALLVSLVRETSEQTDDGAGVAGVTVADVTVAMPRSPGHSAQGDGVSDGTPPVPPGSGLHRMVTVLRADVPMGVAGRRTVDVKSAVPQGTARTQAQKRVIATERVETLRWVIAHAQAEIDRLSISADL